MSCSSNLSYSCSSNFCACTPPSTRRPHPHVHTLMQRSLHWFHPPPPPPALCILALPPFFLRKQRGSLSTRLASPTYSPTHSNAHLSRKAAHKPARGLRCSLPGAFSPTLPLAPWGEAPWACTSILQKKSLLFLNHEILSGVRGGGCYWGALCSLTRPSPLKSQLSLSVCPSSSQSGASAPVPPHSGPTPPHRWKAPLESLPQPGCLDCSIKHWQALVTLS